MEGKDWVVKYREWGENMNTFGITHSWIWAHDSMIRHQISWLAISDLIQYVHFMPYIQCSWFYSLKLFCHLMRWDLSCICILLDIDWDLLVSSKKIDSASLFLYQYFCVPPNYISKVSATYKNFFIQDNIIIHGSI